MALFPGFFGYNFLFWIIISLMRFFTDEIPRFFTSQLVIRGLRWVPPHGITSRHVAVIMAAHNEERALPATLAALKKNVPAENIYIGSDASTDRTAQIARELGCRVVDLRPNRGKSRMLSYLLKHFHILKRYEAVLIMDAEVIVSNDYLETILPYFDEPDVVAFVSHAHSRWEAHRLPKWSMIFTAYRTRLWLMLYYGLRYGQTWRYACATPIIPGGSSVYRSSALKHIEIDTPGFIIEDFHMTFQVYHKKLGRIASHPSAYIIDQEPYNLRDYFWQVHRWFLGFWQALFHHGYWPSFFWFATMFFTLEMVVYALFIVLVPFILLAMAVYTDISLPLWYLTFYPLGLVSIPINVFHVIGGVFLIDYLITVLAAAIVRKPLLLIYGLGFFILRYVDTIVFLVTIPEALLTHSTTGAWKSPVRK